MENDSYTNRKEYLLPYHKVEQVMRKALTSPSKSKDSDSLNSHYEIKIDRSVVELMQDILTEFICFITNDMAEDVSKEKRVSLKG